MKRLTRAPVLAILFIGFLFAFLVIPSALAARQDASGGDVSPFCTPTPSCGCDCDDFEVYMTVDAPTHQVGDLIEYRVEVDNVGDCSSTKYVTFDVYWTSNLTYVSYTSGWSCSNYGDHLHCGRNDYDWGGSYTYIRMRAVAPGNATMDVRNFQVEADYIDSTGTACPSNTASATTNIQQPPTPTPTPTPTATPTFTPTSTPTPTPTATPTSTPTPTPTLVPARLGDRVWYDANRNGVQDAGEPGIPNVTLELYSGSLCSGTRLQTTTTNSTGIYEFTGLSSGTYSVKFLPPAGYAFTLADQGGDTTDSDADPTSGCAGPISLSPGDDDRTWDAGLYGVGRLGDRVWADTDGDAEQDAGETQGIYNVPLHITGLDDLGQTVDITVTTSITGFYLLDNLVPGTYTVTAPATFSGFVRTSTSPQTTTLSAGHMEDLTLDFGYIAPTAVSLVAFHQAPSPFLVQLSWQIRKAGNQADVRFRVWRSEGGGPWRMVSPRWLEATSLFGGTLYYEYVDASVFPGRVYEYHLETQQGDLFGPWNVRVPRLGSMAGSRFYVPWIRWH